MTRRIPPALGIIMVIAAMRWLQELAPLLSMVLQQGMFEWIFVLLVGGGIAQLVAGLAVAAGWRSARVAVLVWTLFQLAIVIFARQTFGVEATPLANALVIIEVLAGPAIVWLVPMFAGELVPQPQIPRAHLVSGAPPANAHPVDVFARRYDVGVVVFGLGLVWILWPLLSQLVMYASMVRADGITGGGFLGELVWVGHAIAVGVFAFIAARRLLDPDADVRRARRAFAIFILVDVAGVVLRTLLAVGFHLLTDTLDSHFGTMIIANTLTGAVLGLVVPLFLWFYARPALSHRDEAPPHPGHARIASAPAWALLWIAPLLLVRMFIAQAIGPSELTSGVLAAIVIACVVQGIAHLVAAIATFTAQRASDDMEPARSEAASRVARIASIVGLVNAMLLTAGWVVLAVTGDAFAWASIPSGPLVQLIACTATLWWALSRRR